VLAGVPWLPSYFENTRRIFAPGSLADFTLAGPVRFNMINAQVLFYSLLGNVSLAAWLARLLAAGLLGWWVWLSFRRQAHSELLLISAISVVSLIAIYHRFYDAALLIWPLAWSLLLVRRRSTLVVTSVAIAPFLIPGQTLLSELARKGRIPEVIINGWWWNTIVMPHEIWALIFLAVFLLYSATREWEGNPLPPSPVSPAVRQRSALAAR